MATLEKIRSKSVFLLIVIFVALLAFILGDAITNGRNLFGNHTVVAKVGNEKIDYLDYQRKREALNAQLEEARKQNPQQFESFDQQRLPQMAVNQLISERLHNGAVDRVGIQASPEQLRMYMFNSQPTPEMINLVRQLQSTGINVASIEQAHSVIFNPKANGMTQAQAEPFQKAWLALENDAKRALAQQTYIQLLTGTVKANDLDKKALFNDYVAVTDVAVAYRPYGQLDEKKYPVSDAEIKKAYDSEKRLFRVQEPTKAVSFIAVSVAPSEADRAESSRLAVSAASILRDTAVNATKALKKEELSIERLTRKGADVPAGAIKDFVASAPRDSVKIVTDNMRGFTVVRMGKRYLDVDSVQLNLVTVAGGSLPAKVLARLNAGLDVDSISKIFPADSVMVQAKQWITLYNERGRSSDLSTSQLDSLRSAGGKYVRLMNSGDATLLAQLAGQGAPTEIYEYEIVDYALQPSVKTLDAEREKLDKFLADNATAAAFNKNAEKAGYNIQKFQLSQSSDAVPRMAGYSMYYPDSRQVVRWVMLEGKPGEVSHAYQSNDALRPMLYAVAVDSEYDDYVPMTDKDVKQYLTDKVRREKAGDEMVKQYGAKASSIESAALAMGVEPRQLDAFRFSPRAGVNDPSVIGKIAAAKPSGKVVVVKGDDGVYAFVVKSHKNEKAAYDPQTYEQQYLQMVNPNPELMLRGAKKIQNNVYKFEAGD